MRGAKLLATAYGAECAGWRRWRGGALAASGGTSRPVCVCAMWRGMRLSLRVRVRVCPCRRGPWSRVLRYLSKVTPPALRPPHAPRRPPRPHPPQATGESVTLLYRICGVLTFFALPFAHAFAVRSPYMPMAMRKVESVPNDANRVKRDRISRPRPDSRGCSFSVRDRPH